MFWIMVLTQELYCLLEGELASIEAVSCGHENAAQPVDCSATMSKALGESQHDIHQV